MDQLESYLRKWSLSAPEKVAETATSFVYKARRQGRIVVLKILTPLGQKDEVDGAKTLAHFAGQGAVELLASDEDAQLLEYADGLILKELVLQGQDEKATHVMADLFAKIHRPVVSNTLGLQTMEENFRALFRHHQDRPEDETMAEAARITQRLLQSPQSQVVLHGDVHHKNVLHSTERGWLLIDPKGLFGERTYDFANVFYNPDDQPGFVETSERIEELARVFAERFALDPRRILEFAFAYGCLSACWALEDGLDPARRLRIANLIRHDLQFKSR